MSYRFSWSAAARSLLVAGAFGAGLLATSCKDDTITSPTSNRVYNQVQRLGNPLVSEVLLAKRDHPYHGSIGPDRDVAELGPKIKAFDATVAGRSVAHQNALVGALLPDMLIVQTDKDPTTAGWLSWALSNGYGGRKLTDDVVDAALSAVFGKILETAGASCDNFTLPLCTDNVGSHGTFLTTFPYLGVPK